MDQLKESYRSEAREILNELETTLLELEETPNDFELIGKAFRSIHTIKGSGAMFGFDDIVAFSHEMETFFDLLRNRKMAISKEFIDAALMACDMIEQMLDGTAVDMEKTSRIVQAFKEMIPDQEYPDKKVVQADEGETKKENTLQIFRIRFKPDPDIFETGTNPIFLLEELAGLSARNLDKELNSLENRNGALFIPDEVNEFPGYKAKALILNIPEINELNPEICYMSWDIILATRHGIKAIMDVFIFVEDRCGLTIDLVAELDHKDPEDIVKKLGEILVARGDVSRNDVENAFRSQKRLGEILIQEKAVNKDIIESALMEQQQLRKIQKSRDQSIESSTIRVPAEKLDSLASLVGELVTIQARLSRKTSEQDDPEFIAISEIIERITAELRDNTMDIRMIPISTSFARFKRLIRDLSRELGKEIVLETEGGETELDKSIIERIYDPMVHIIRNCIDHGIEMPQVRKAAGKPTFGKIRLSAAYMGSSVIITIYDDGRGLDAQAIRETAVRKGLVSAEDSLGEDEMYSMIFAPGFSTAGKVTDLSGRGVGMDVVKRSIEALRGKVRIHSEFGSGTTITMDLPLTLAIIEGLLVELDQAYYVLPLSIVEECVEVHRNHTDDETRQNFIDVRGNIVPFVGLRNLFGINTPTRDTEHIVVAEVEGSRFGIVVDKVIGEHQTVIKSLGKIYKYAKTFTGATILADGTLALILDVHRLTEIAKMEEASMYRSVA